MVVLSQSLSSWIAAVLLLGAEILHGLLDKLVLLQAQGLSCNNPMPRLGLTDLETLSHGVVASEACLDLIHLCSRCGWFPEAYVKPLEDAREMEEPTTR